MRAWYLAKFEGGVVRPPRVKPQSEVRSGVVSHNRGNPYAYYWRGTVNVCGARPLEPYDAFVFTPTCQVCGATLRLDDGISIETVIRRGMQDGEPDAESYWDWNQELRYRFCGEAHLKSWLSTLSLPPYEPQTDETEGSVWEALGLSALAGFLLMTLAGALFGFVLLIEKIF